MKLLVMIFSPEFVAEKISTFDTEYLRPFVERGTNFKNRVGHEEPVNTEIRYQHTGDLPGMAGAQGGLSAYD